MVIALNPSNVPTWYFTSAFSHKIALVVEVPQMNSDIAVVTVFALSSIIYCHIVVKLADTSADA